MSICLIIYQPVGLSVSLSVAEYQGLNLLIDSLTTRYGRLSLKVV
jgi:hypothetical protein